MGRLMREPGLPGKTGGPGSRRREALLALTLFCLMLARYCAFGFTYYYQLDDYIQYVNYPNSSSFSALCDRVGLLASRPWRGSSTTSFGASCPGPDAFFWA